MRKISFILLCSLFTSSIYSNTVEIPNEKIFENPKKEVTTIESKKKEEHAEMNIKVNKFNIQNILGHKIENEKIQYFIPKEKNNKVLKTLINDSNSEYLIFKTKKELISYLNKKSYKQKKGTSVQGINYKVLRDSEFDMLTVDTNQEVYILNNKNEIFHGSPTARTTSFAQALRLRLERTYVKYFFGYGRQTIEEIKKLPLAYLFISDFLQTGTNLDFWLSNGYGYNKLKIRRDNTVIGDITLGSTPNLTTDKRLYGLEYVSGTTFPMNLVSVVLNKSDNYKAMNGNSIYQTAIDFRNVVDYTSTSFDIQSSIYMRGNWTGSTSVMADGHNVNVTFEYDVNRFSYRRTELGVTLDNNDVNKYLYGNNSPYSDSLAVRSSTFNYNTVVKDYNGPNNDVFYTIKNSGYDRGAYLDMPSNNYIADIRPIQGQWYYPMIKFKQKYLFNDVRLNNIYVKNRFQWGDFRVYRYDITMNKNTENFGEIWIEVDKRIKKSRQNSNIDTFFINGVTGQVYNSLTRVSQGNSNDLYPRFVNHNGAGLLIGSSDNRAADIEEVTGRPYKIQSSQNYSVYSENNSSNERSILAYGGTSVSSLQNGIWTAKISNNNRSGNFRNDSEIFYRLNRDKRFGRLSVHVDEIDKYYEGTGNVDLTNLRAWNSYDWPLKIFKNGTTGNQASSNSSVTLNITKGKLFDLWGVQDKESLVTKVELYENNKLVDQGEYQANLKGVWLSTPDDLNRFYFLDDRFQIQKAAPHSSSYSTTISRNFKIIPYYKDVPLGILELTVKNFKEKILPDKKFIIDSRLVRNSSIDTILESGGNRYNVSGNSLQLLGNYSEFMKVEGTIGTQDSERVSSVQAQDKPNTQTIGNYIKYYSGASSSTGVSIFPVVNEYLLVSTLDSNMAVYLNNSGQNETQLFKVVTNGYTKVGDLNITEEYKNDGYFEGIGELNLGALSNQEEAKWGTNNAGNKGALQSLTNNAILNISSGNFFNLKSIFTNKVLATKLVVKRNSSNPVEVTGEINQKKEITTEDNVIGIDENGAFYIKKKSGNIANNVHYDIEVYYKDICLGKLSLNVKHSSSGLILEGIDAFDFGVLTKGISQSLEGKFIIKGTPGGNLNLISIDIPQTANMTITTPNMNDKIPIEIRSSHQKIGNEINGIINVKANVPQTANPGNYAGEINLIVNVQ